MPEGLKIDVVLVFAGPTSWDLAGRLAGRTDLPLAAEGLAAAQRVAEAIAPLAPASILSGSDEASIATAAAIGKSARVKPKALAALAALDLGLWEGMTKAELIDRCPRVCRALQTDPASIVPPNGEAWTDLRTRAMSAILSSLPRKSGGPLVVVARPSTILVLRAAIDELSGRPPFEYDCTASPAWGTLLKLTLEPTQSAVERSWIGVAALGLGMLGMAAGPWPPRG